MTAAVSKMALLGDAGGFIPALRENDIIAPLLILVVGIAMGMCLTGMFLMVHFLRRGRLASRRLPRHRQFLDRERRYQPPVVQAPSRWLAIKNGHPQLVQAALGLHNPKPCSWEEGLSVMHDQKLFISPPVAGWILVMGANMPEPGEDVDKCFRFILDLSRKLGQVQFFSVHRAVNHHAWVHADQGTIVRAYAWAGRTLWNQGRLTRAEIELGLKCYGYGEGEDRIDYGKVDPTAVNTERVPLLASRWSLDPTAIDARVFRESQGIAGQLSRSRAI